MKIKPEDAGLFELLDRILDQGISFEAWLRLFLPNAEKVEVAPVYIWTYLHFGEMWSRPGALLTASTLVID